LELLLAEAEKEAPKLAHMLSTHRASEPMLVLGKYLVKGKRVTEVVEDGT
jgi:hypothetical protein